MHREGLESAPSELWKCERGNS